VTDDPRLKVALAGRTVLDLRVEELLAAFKETLGDE
jgi:hypothetical protein